MHHISVQIINESDTDDSTDEFAEFLYEDVGDSEVFLQMWRSPSPSKSGQSLAEEASDASPLSCIHRAYLHMKAAMSDITAARSVLQSTLAPSQAGFAVQKVDEDAPCHEPTMDEIYIDRIHQLAGCRDVLLGSAAQLREEVGSSQKYFRSLATLSQKFPLKLIENEKEQNQISVAMAHPTSTNIIISESEEGLRWSLSDDSKFSFNGKSFNIDAPPYLTCFFELMCHELFERIKNDKIKSAIHYSADRTTRSVYFDVGNRETWVFELGAAKEIGEVPVWIPRLIDLIMQPHSQPATFMRQLLFFKATLDSMSNAFCGRFLNLDFCNVTRKTAMCKAALQIDSDYIYIPYMAFIDKWRVSMTETPNELRCIPYSTDGRGLTPALEKWCDASFATLFLAMAEKVTRSFGFVFKNKNQYGTATIGSKKIRFQPQQKTNDVDITITARNSVKARWKRIPGTNHTVRMCVVLFQDLSGENLE